MKKRTKIILVCCIILATVLLAEAVYYESVIFGIVGGANIGYILGVIDEHYD